MSEGAGREWRFYVDDMIAFGEKVVVYTKGFDQCGFVSSGLTYDATLRNLERSGDAHSRRRAVSASRDSMAAHRGYPKPGDSRLSWYR